MGGWAQGKVNAGKSEFRSLRRKPQEIHWDFQELKIIQYVWKASSKKWAWKSSQSPPTGEEFLARLRIFFFFLCEHGEAIEHGLTAF